MRRTPLAICLVAGSTLALELLLTRIFDVILYPNLAYMIITGAVFSFGLAGIYTTLRPLPAGADPSAQLARLTALMAASLLLIRPLLNIIPFRFEAIASDPLGQGIWFLAMYAVITIPFVLCGLVLARVFSAWAEAIQRLYFWDLAGAAVGCVAIIPLIPILGPAGLLLVVSGVLALAAAVFAGTSRALAIAAVYAVVMLAIPLLSPGYLSFEEHKVDRGLADARAMGNNEYVRWDPVSKVEVIHFRGVKNIIYDGGSQSSFLYPFDGNWELFRRRLDRGVQANAEGFFKTHFWTRSVLLAHYMKRDTDQQVLVIGSAAGQEVKGALAYGAGHVDAIEMVGAVVELGKHDYAGFNGGIFNDPRVNSVRGEGRGFIRSRDRVYDIIQIFSNHSSSSVAAGAGALDPTYLLTADAFVDYFQHLSEDGMLQINHHTYPRIISTAALAWKWMGRDDFRSHVLVTSRTMQDDDTLPMVLIKMSPFTRDDLVEARRFLGLREGVEVQIFKLEENPLRPRTGFLSPEFFSGELPDEIIERVPYRVTPTTDNRPYFKFLRRGWEELQPDPERFVPVAVAWFLNVAREQGGGVPLDIIHLWVTGFVSLVFAGVFVVTPLALSPVARRRWPGWGASLIYFASLGAGFILVELVLIQLLMHFVGYPLYTYSVVLFTVLLGAGLGSLASDRLRITPAAANWWWPYAGVLLAGTMFLLVHGPVTGALLALPLGARLVAAVILVFPIAFFMGMPFPLGVLAVQDLSRAAVAWGWGMNGLFTVIGGLGSVVVSVNYGFRAALIVGLMIYAIAWLSFARMRRQRSV